VGAGAAFRKGPRTFFFCLTAARSGGGAVDNKA